MPFPLPPPFLLLRQSPRAFSPSPRSTVSRLACPVSFIPAARRNIDSSMKKLLNGGSIESACHNSYDKNQANGRINQLSILSSVIIPNFFLSLFPHSVFFL